MDFQVTRDPFKKAAPGWLPLHFKWGHHEYTRLYRYETAGARAPDDLHNGIFFFLFKHPTKNHFKIYFDFTKPFNLLLPGECTRSKREQTTSHHARNNIISFPSLENIAKITTDDYSCWCYFKQRINWCLVFAHWSRWQSAISILGRKKWKQLSGGVKTSFVFAGANLDGTHRPCAVHPFNMLTCILCFVLSHLVLLFAFSDASFCTKAWWSSS